MNIKINIGGQIFETTFDTITKIPYFRDMFEACGEAPNETLFVNRPPHIFKHILAFIIDPLYPFPKKYTFELDFYGIDYKNINLYEQNSDKIKELKDEICDIYCKNEKLNGKIDRLSDKMVEICDELKIEIGKMDISQYDDYFTVDGDKCMICNKVVSYAEKYCNHCYQKGEFCDVRDCFNRVHSNVLHCDIHKK